MRLAILFLLVAASAGILAQAPAVPAGGPRYDVVSIKRNTSGALGSNGSVPQRPDGGFIMLNIPIGTLVGRAYEVAPIDMVGLPAWAMSERYDVTTTSTLARATPEEGRLMLRAMLAERAQLVAKIEPREQPVYDLVLARADRSLGPGITRSETDCEARLAAQRAAAEAALASGSAPPPPVLPDFNAAPSCSYRILNDGMEGESAIAGLTTLLRQSAGRPVVDKTGLAGTFRIKLTFDRAAGTRSPEVAPAVGAPPSIFTALPEQLGLRLDASKAMRPALVVERLERPTEN